MTKNSISIKSLIIITIASLLCTLPFIASAHEPISYEKNVKLFEKTKKAQTLIDSAYGRKSNLSEAAALLDEVVVADKDFVPAYIEMSRVVLSGGHLVNYEFRSGTLELANTLLIKAKRINPEYGGTYVLLGHVYSMAGQLDAASAALAKAGSLGTDNPWLHNNSAYIFYFQGKYTAAKIAYEKIMAKGPGKTSQQRNSYLDALEKLMNIAYQESNDERLVQLAKTIVNVVHPNNAWAWGNAGGLLCREGFFDLGLEYNQKALSIMRYGVAEANVAFCLFGKWAELTEAGKYEKADIYFSKAYQINPDVRSIAEDFSVSGARLRTLRKIFDKKIEKLDKLNNKKTIKSKTLQGVPA